MDFNTLLSTRKTVTIFKTIEDFVNDNVHFDDLVLDNFRGLFMAYYSFCVLILVVWLASRPWTQASTHRLKLWLRELRL